MTDFDIPERAISGVLYEKELQDAIASDLTLLKLGNLNLIGKEYAVDFGRIDILAQDINGAFFVIETKREQASRDAIAQIQSYMGAIKLANTSSEVRGVLVATSLDASGQAALSMASNVSFCQLVIKFEFVHHLLSTDTATRSMGKSEEEKVRSWQMQGGKISHYSSYCEKCQARKSRVVLGSNSLCFDCGAILK